MKTYRTFEEYMYDNYYDAIYNKVKGFLFQKKGTSFLSTNLIPDVSRFELDDYHVIMVEQCEKRTGVSANAYTIKYMKTRWGSCNIEDRRIILNLQLVKKPIVCLEYVIFHELTHLIERNHTNRFKALISGFMPN